jgi:DNA-binding transcriptional LysR family regulator
LVGFSEMGNIGNRFLKNEIIMADLNSLVIFAKVVESGSFTEAARRLKMPVSTVCRRVAELEDDLRVRLVERSTRNLRLTDVGSVVLEHARKGADLSEAVDSLVTSHHTHVQGTLRISAPPSISDSLVAPVIRAFQGKYPDVSFQVFITDRIVDQIAEGVDLAFRVGPLKDSTLIARKLLTYRHQLLASPSYFEGRKLPRHPQDLLNHRLLAFSFWLPHYCWSFSHVNGTRKETLSFEPYIAMNDYAGIANALATGAGIGELPPILKVEPVRSGQLVEVLPNWHLPRFDLALVHLGNRCLSRPMRAFKDFVAEFAPRLFAGLPT